MLGLTAKEELRCLDLPQSSVGAPLPHVFADEHRLLIAYILQVNDPTWDGSTVRIIGPETKGEECAVVDVQQYRAFEFGPPNDEAIAGHRLHKLGLRPYSAFEVLNSKWIATLEEANRVHPHHRSERFAGDRHIILTFHDSTLEFVAERFEIRRSRGSVRNVLLDRSE